MQIQLQTSQIFSQQSFLPKESEIPFFEDAFDTESLRKFFQERDSHLSTPSTSRKDSSIPEEFETFEQDSKCMFGSSFARYIKNCSDELPLARYSFGLELDEGLDTQMRIFSDKERSSIRTQPEVGGIDWQLMLQRIYGFSQANESNKMEIPNGSNRISINVVERNPPQGKIQYLEATTGQGRDQRSKKGEWFFENKTGKKSVFIIERNVKPWMITKQKQEKLKIPSMTKKKSVQLPNTQQATRSLLENQHTK
jgi:hypothetical protein